MNDQLRAKLNVALDILNEVRTEEAINKDSLPDSIEGGEAGQEMAQNIADIATSVLMINRVINR